MAAMELDMLSQNFKALGDETRLKIICLLSEQPYNVGELAGALQLTEPTVSHHLGKLRDLGLLNMDSVGNKRYYKLNDALLNNVLAFFNPETMARISAYLLSEEPTAAAYHQQQDSAARARSEAWLAELDVSDADRKVLKDYTLNGKLKQIPTKEKKLLAVLRWLAQEFVPGERYTEFQVNQRLERYYHDYVTLRRELVEFGFLEREPAGRTYWVSEG
ncbi:MAG: metalloregulator ArsR/SmtB family transcription factor [Chloroflexi bacterium]|nr:metalloregulator ArsR/SmtB family transcription factor [Chloroflexota bacterium]